MILLPLSAVSTATHLEFSAPGASGDGGQIENALIHVYAGWIQVGFAAGDINAVAQESYKSFVPLDVNGRVLTYDPGAPFNVTVSVAPASFACSSDFEDEPGTTAVNSATVALEPQIFGGVGGTPNLLVLRAELAAQRSTIFSITYQVTTAAPAAAVLDELNLSLGAAPA
ncbi:hypothetical protein [Nocardia sp. NPDC050406]|uniref:hypothetical protein n=1 Tax=Nocardia sp. NPDC050406 TaxID=3364318 RepID=UPI0037A8561D